MILNNLVSRETTQDLEFPVLFVVMDITSSISKIVGVYSDEVEATKTASGSPNYTIEMSFSNIISI